MSRLRAVLDTNCYISTLVFKGRLNRLRTAWGKRLFVQLASKETMAELERVLSYEKFNLAPNRREEILDEVLFHSEMCVLSDPLAPVPGLRDPKDIVFVNLAREAKADYLVSGDAHLHELKGALPDVEIVSPGEFLGVIGWSVAE